MGFLDDAWKGITGATGLDGFHQDSYTIDDNAFNPNGDELALNKALQARSAGQAPSVAESQLRMGVDQAQQNASSMAASQRGINPALAAKLAQDAGAQASAQSNGQAAALRAQEQQAADAQLAQALQAQRQGRMSGQQLHVQQTQGANQIGMQSYQNQAQNMSGLIRGGAQAMSMGAFADGGVVKPIDNSQSLRSASDAFSSSFANAIASQMMPTPNNQGSPQDQKANADAYKSIFSKILSGGSGQPQTMAGGPGDNMGAIGGPEIIAAANGSVVPGHAKVQGDSSANDIVPAMLSPGEIVVPRTVAQMSPDKIAQFVSALKRGA